MIHDEPDEAKKKTCRIRRFDRPCKCSKNTESQRREMKKLINLIRKLGS